MTHAWSAEAVVDEALVRTLLAEVPGLELRSVRPLAEGWDRDVWLVNEELAVGFPRRAIGLAGIERELAVLPRLAPRLPLPISEPVLVAPAGAGFPWPFAASRYIAGVELWQADLDEAHWTRLLVALAGFLRQLHASDVLAAFGEELPLDPNRRIDMAVRVPKTREFLARIEELGIWTAPPSVAELLAEAERLPPPEALAVCHGDLHVRHVLVSDGAIAGVIDWNDMCRADPALDLSLLWSVVPLELHDTFFTAYGVCTRDQAVRARVIALCLCSIMAEQAHVEGNAALLSALVTGLDRAA